MLQSHRGARHIAGNSSVTPTSDGHPRLKACTVHRSPLNSARKRAIMLNITDLPGLKQALESHQLVSE